MHLDYNMAQASNTQSSLSTLPRVPNPARWLADAWTNERAFTGSLHS